MPFGDDVSLRRPEAAPLVEPPQPGVNGGVRRFLQRQVERSLDGEALLVQLLRPVGALQVLAHLLDEVRRRRLAGRGLPLDRRQASPSPRPRPPARCSRRPPSAAARSSGGAWRAGDPRTGFGARAAARCRAISAASSSVRSRRPLVEIHARGRLHPVRAVPEVHVVAVEGQDLALRVALLDLDREDRFLDLPLPRLVERQEQVARELLRERARAGALPVDDVARRRDRRCEGCSGRSGVSKPASSAATMACRSDTGMSS